MHFVKTRCKPRKFLLEIWVVMQSTWFVTQPFSPLAKDEHSVIFPVMSAKEILYWIYDQSYFVLHVGVHDDGDIFNEDNLVEFRRFVMESTDNKGVHFAMADGVGKRLCMLQLTSLLRGYNRSRNCRKFRH